MLINKIERRSGVETKSTLRGRGEARRPEGPKLKARMAEPVVGFLGRGGKPPPLPQWGPGKDPAAKSFGAFWVFRVSSPAAAVLLLDQGVIHSSFCGSSAL